MLYFGLIDEKISPSDKDLPVRCSLIEWIGVVLIVTITVTPIRPIKLQRKRLAISITVDQWYYHCYSNPFN